MRRLTPRRFALQMGACALVLIGVLLVSPGVGTQPIGVAQAWSAWWSGRRDADVYVIAFGLRFPATVKALLAGATLALGGGVYQCVFRNPLATPYTLGVASGASLGAMIAILAGWAGPLLGLSPVAWSAFVGAGLVLAVVFLLARTSRRVSGDTLLLAGVTIGFFCSAMILFVTHLASPHDTYQIVRWLMGSLETVGYGELPPLLPVLLPAWLVLVLLARWLNQYELGDEISAARGVHPARLQLVCLGLSSLAVAAVVSVCGPIGFVGLIVPHGVRLVFGGDNRIVLPASLLVGATFLIVCDWLSAMIPSWYGALIGRELSAARLPIGVMTSLIGAPLFLWILRSRGQKTAN